MRSGQYMVTKLATVTMGQNTEAESSSAMLSNSPWQPQHIIESPLTNAFIGH